jgi:dTDP-4-dehydrorhamnose 3,5-epimerase
MKVIEAAIPDVLLLEPQVFEDERGYFFESYNRKTLKDLGINYEFVQDNHSRSRRGVLRGLHYQIRQPQGKLVRVIEGEVFDVAVDIRRSSPTFGQWAGFNLSAANKRIAWIPPGFAHGFLVLSETAELLYKTTDYWASQYERCIRWNDPGIRIEWPLTMAPVMSDKDRVGAPLQKAPVYD